MLGPNLTICTSSLWGPRVGKPSYHAGSFYKQAHDPFFLSWPSLKAWSKEDSENRIELPWIFKWNRGLSSVWYIESKAKPFDSCSIWRITGGGCLQIPHCGGSLNFSAWDRNWIILSFSHELKLIRMLSCYGGTHQKQGPWPTFEGSTRDIGKNVSLLLLNTFNIDCRTINDFSQTCKDC